ncbi:hypothetical protein B0G57_10887 [Trinickia symbiotica]|uniref:Uncharacterized protein n=1 Tax=Trinickia symbiotica TaxID=863227 RepID=A0A2N7X2L9_9BURK|nr:hypothetical protein [Trinickia symbiotica]PMS35850.1 hypothetical protein C0Z20_16110 [Trinickia symbiotica]PPK44507.1 hypothetical protein B0G57_10887 [Trinickia symbiotica]
MGDKDKEVRQAQDQRHTDEHDEQREEERIDRGVEDTFPASDPTAVGGATRIESGREANGEGKPSEDDGAPGSAPGKQRDDDSSSGQ